MLQKRATKNAPEITLSADLRKVMMPAKVAAQWQSLTPIARRDFVSWVESAKQSETRKRRVDSIPSRLASGKRRPCCYAIVPMNVYKALGANTKAKAQWKILTPDEKRDFVGWIDTAPDTASQKIRIAKACSLLISGARRPSV